MLGDHGMAGGVGMDAVSLVESAVRGHPIEQERDEPDLRPARHLGKDPGERRRIIAVVGGKAHPRQEDSGSGIATARDDLLQVPLHGGKVLTAQAVVRAERHDDDLGARVKHPG